MENIKVLPITKDYLECVVKFDEKYNNIIEEIKNRYYNNLNDDYQEDIQTINNINEEEFIKYIEKNNNTESLSCILFGSLEYYNTEDVT